MRPADRNGFEIAIICALTLEADAVEALFDETYDKFSQDYGRQPRDTNAYITGRVGQHSVVLCYLPGMGIGSAAGVVANLRFSYPCIHLALVVGICGGVPFPSSNTKIIMGDVIISDSLIQYDFGRQYPDGFQRKCDVKETLGRPNQEIRTFLVGMKGRKTRSELQERIYQHLQTLQGQDETVWQHPGALHDVVFKASYRHKHNQQEPVAKSGHDPVCDEAMQKDCNGLGCAGKPVYCRQYGVETIKPSVHIGTIASANTVMKSGEHRDKLAEKEGIIGFEMEGAGVWDNMPCIIIKGVCDYADSHKNKTWQDYAAATAASGAKALLEYWKSSSSQPTFITKPERPHITSYLQGYYTTAKRLQVQRISGELLPMDQCYINLAVVEQLHSAKADSTHQSSPFSIFARLKVENIDKDKQVSLPQLFQPREQPDGTSIIPKRILIQGRAGVGKTTLCKKIVNDYLHHDMWRQLFDVLLWVPLRRLKMCKLPDKHTLVDLFHDLYFSQHKEGKDLARDLWETVSDPIKKTKALFILDGLDEVSQEWDPETPMHNVLLHLLDHPQVIITSRPYGMNLGHLESFDLELETIGFNPNQVEAYIMKMVKQDPNKADGILAFIRKHALIQGLVQIPIQLDALCYSWDSNFMFGDEPKTMTTLYQAITLKLWQKDIPRLGKSKAVKGLNEYSIRSLRASEIQELVPDEISLLENLAFHGFYNDVIDFNAKDRHRVYDYLKSQGTVLPAAPDIVLKKVSFLHTSDTTVMDQDQSYHFLHLTFQEFFAARYFVRQWMKHEQLLCIRLRQRIPESVLVTPQAFLQKEKYNSRYNILWRFVAGLLQDVPGDKQKSEESLKCYFQELEAEPRDLLGPAHQRILMHCLSEVIPDKKSDLDLHVKMEDIPRWLQFECHFHDNIWLGRERECPEHFLKTLILEGSVVVQSCVLAALSERQDLSTDILQALVALLKDNNSRVSYQAARALSRQSSLPYDILQALVTILKDYGSHVKSQAAVVLGQQSSLPHDILQALVALLRDDNPRLSYLAAVALGQQSSLPHDILQALVPLLKDDGSHVRDQAARALSGQSSLSHDILQALVALLKDDYLPVRAQAAVVLGQQSSLPPDILQALVALLKDDDSHVRNQTAVALGQQSSLPHGILQALAVLLRDDESHVRDQAARALGRQSSLPHDILQVLIPLLRDDKSHVSYQAAHALGQQLSLPHDILQALAVLLRDDGSHVRALAAVALGQQSSLPPDILQALTALLRDDKSHVRALAAVALGQQSSLPHDILQALAVLLRDDKSHVSFQAAHALGQQSSLPLDILQALVPLLRDDDSHVRAQAAHALSQQSSLPHDILQALIPLLKCGSDELSAAAEAVLRNHREFYFILPSLSVPYFKSLYSIWLKRSFREQVSCCLRDNCLCIDTPEGLWKIPFEKRNQEVFKGKIQAARLALGVPSCNSLQRSRTGLWIKVKTFFHQAGT